MVGLSKISSKSKSLEQRTNNSQTPEKTSGKKISQENFQFPPEPKKKTTTIKLDKIQRTKQTNKQPSLPH